MNYKLLTRICLSLFLLFFVTACEQNQIVKEELSIPGETEVNGEDTGEEDLNIETNEIFTTEETVEISNRLKVLILPFDNKADLSEYPNAKTVNAILQNELHAFLYVVPTFDIPEKSELAVMDSGFLNRKNITANEIYSNYQADIIIFGDYILHGSKTDPAAQIHLNIWKKASGNVEAREYDTPTDADIFDTIDDMLSNIIDITLKKEIKVAFLNFGNFKVGDGSYFLFINNKKISMITNDNFSLNLKILPNAMYSIRLKNLKNNRIVLNTTALLRPGETTNISHSTLGIIKCTMKNITPDENFQVFLDENEIKINEIISNLRAEKRYLIKVIDKNKKSYTDSVYLSDGEFKNLILPKYKIALNNFINTNVIHYSTFKSFGSSLTIPSLTNIMIDGRKSFSAYFMIPFYLHGNAGIGFRPGKNKSDWTEMNTFKIWVYGKKTRISYFIRIIDALNESYSYWLTDDWSGWKQISIPLDSFKISASKIKNKTDINKHYPLKRLVFGMDSAVNNSSAGKFRLTIGKMSVTRE